MTIQELARIKRFSQALRQHRDDLTKALNGVRASITQLGPLGALAACTTITAREEARMIGADSDDNLRPIRTYFFHEYDVDGVTLLNTVTRTIEYDPSGQWAIKVDGNDLYMFNDPQTPTVYEMLSVIHGMLSYAHYAGEMTDVEVQALIGQAPAPTAGLADLLDTWQ